MKINIWKIPWGYEHSEVRKRVPFTIHQKGYIEADQFQEEECFHLCNWGCWADNKPENLYSDVEVANSDIIFHNPEEDKYYLALPVGWHTENTLEEMINFITTSS